MYKSKIWDGPAAKFPASDDYMNDRAWCAFESSFKGMLSFGVKPRGGHQMADVCKCILIVE